MTADTEIRVEAGGGSAMWPTMQLATALQLIALKLAAPAVAGGRGRGRQDRRRPRPWPRRWRRRLIRLQCYEGLDAPPRRSTNGTISANCCHPCPEQRGTCRPGLPRTQIFSEEFLLASARCSRPSPGPAAGAADRRDRPGRRGIRGVPAGDPVRLPGHHPGDSTRSAATSRSLCHPDVQRHPRTVGRAAAALPLQLCRVSRSRWSGNWRSS